jgi:hypothetical protein
VNDLFSTMAVSYHDFIKGGTRIKRECRRSFFPHCSLAFAPPSVWLSPVIIQINGEENA